jgi:glycosyltransferase involved in cell wall biosynthesis
LPAHPFCAARIAATLQSQPDITANAPYFSVVIPVYNDWGPLDRCLRALAGQVNAPQFEVIIVDDGSDPPVGPSLRAWNNHFLLTILHQPHSGIAAARNLGIQRAKGQILVFTDTDCEMRSDCLSALHTALLKSPQHNSFQLHMVSDCSTVIGRAEELRLMSIQNQTLRSDGCIRYLNTAGCAIRRSSINLCVPLFDPQAQRAEDTLLLANLILHGEAPLFVPGAIVQHTIELSWIECLLKDMRSAWREGRTYDMIAAKGVTVRMGERERLKMMMSMWNAAKQPSIGRMACLAVIARRTTHRIVRLLYNTLRRPRKTIIRNARQR